MRRNTEGDTLLEPSTCPSCTRCGALLTRGNRDFSVWQHLGQGEEIATFYTLMGAEPWDGHKTFGYTYGDVVISDRWACLHVWKMVS